MKFYSVFKKVLKKIYQIEVCLDKTWINLLKFILLKNHLNFYFYVGIKSIVNGLYIEAKKNDILNYDYMKKS